MHFIQAVKNQHKLFDLFFFCGANNHFYVNFDDDDDEMKEK